MNEKIRDDELKNPRKIKVTSRCGTHRDFEGELCPVCMYDELLSLRSLNKRLVENSKALAKSLESEYYDCDNEPCALAYHRELLAELEGNKFETAMKRVLDENKGAWKALGGEEGKG